MKEGKQEWPYRTDIDSLDEPDPERRKRLEFKQWAESLTPEDIEEIKRKAKQETWDKAIAKMTSNIGMLRQWLNEDRITDPEKMITNEQIEMMLMMGIEYPKQAKEKDI